MPPAFYPSGPVKAIFRGALKSPATDRTAKRSALALSGRIVAFVVVLLLAIFPASMMVGIGKERPVLPNLISVSPDRAARIQALITNAQAPLVLDQNTILTGATSNGMNVTLQYDVFGEASEEMTGQIFAAIMTPMLQESACSDPNFRYIIHNGGSIAFNYRMFRTGNIEEAIVTVGSCS